MHCVYLADIAAIVSEHAPSIIYRREAIPAHAMTGYWVASRNRFELWHQAMARYRSAEVAGDHQKLRQWWTDHFVVLEEVLVSQMLTRVISSIVAEIDEQQPNDELMPVTHAIYLSQLDATKRVHQLMLTGRGISVPEAVKLNRLRQGVERWTDALLGRLGSQSSGEIRYAIDSERAQAFAEETQTCGHGQTRRTVSWLMNASMREMLARRTTTRPALPQANRAVASSVVQLMRPELFDSVGVLRSLYSNRFELDANTSDQPPSEFDTSKKVSGSDEHDRRPNNDCVFQRWYS